MAAGTAGTAGTAATTAIGAARTATAGITAETRAAKSRRKHGKPKFSTVLRFLIKTSDLFGQTFNPAFGRGFSLANFSAVSHGFQLYSLCKRAFLWYN